MSAVGTRVVTPYKGLAPFEDSALDELLFFGRERETEVIVANLLAAKLTVLYGPSGVGKSSILRAAVARRLREEAPDADVVVLDAWALDPTLPDPDGEAFLILDQFEEYFLYHEARPLQEALPALLERPSVHVLLALREDTLARLDAFQAQIPSVFANRLRLDHLDPSAARAAIVGPLDRWNAGAPPDDHMGIESALVDEVLRQVESTPGRIEAPYLQLVMERVWDAERDSRSHVLRVETLRRLGGTEAIVSANLERALGSLPPREAEIATSALKFLVTPSRTKIAHSFGDLVGYTNESPVELQQVLEILASQRILRAVAAGEDEGSRYEIFHDVLAEPVLAWRREFEARTALAAAARRHRRLAIVAGGALLLAAAMIVLAVFALAQRSEASKQRHAARVQADVALGQKERAQRQRVAALHQRQIAIEQTKRAKAAKRAAVVSAATAKASQRRAQLEEQRAKSSAAQAKQSEESAKRNAAAAQASAVDATKARAQAVRLQHFAEGQALIAKRKTLLAKVGQYVAIASAELTVDPVKSVKAALAAAGLETSPRVEDALLDSLQSLWVRGILEGGGGPLNTAVFSPDGSLVATGAGGGDVRIFRTQSHAVVNSLKAGSSVAKIAFSPDGKELAVATAAGKVLLVDVATGDVTWTLAHNGAVLDLVYAGRGRYLVTASMDGSTRIWDPSTGDLLHKLDGTAAQQTIDVSPGGSLVAVVSRGQNVAAVYDVASGTRVASPQQPGEVTDLAFSPNGKYLVTTGRRNGFVWDTSTWQLLHTLTGHEAAIDAVAFASDGRVVTGSIDSSGRVWDPATGTALFTLSGQHQQKVLAVAVSPNGQQIATTSADQTIRVWNAPLGSTPRIYGGHTDSVTGEVYSPDGSLLLTMSADGTARLWGTQVPALRQLGAHQGAVSAVAYDPTGKLVLSASADGTARLWHTDGTVAQTLSQGGKVTDASFVGADVLTAGDDGTAKLWRSTDGSLLTTYPHGSPVRAAVAGGGTVVTVGDDGVVKSWTTAGRLRWAATHGSPLAAAALSVDGTVATGAADGSVRLWRGRDGAPVYTLPGHTDAITSLAFNASGTLLISGSVDDTAIIWDVRTGKRVHSLAAHSQAVTSVSFSPNGKLALTSSADGDARLWSVARGTTTHRLSFHVSTVSQAAFSPDGRWVVTAGPSTAAIWQIRTGRLLYFVRGARGNLTAAAWAPDSMRIVSGDTGGGVETFTCELCGRIPALVAQAKARLAALG
jgi:WD40 repeat protein